MVVVSTGLSIFLYKKGIAAALAMKGETKKIYAMLEAVSAQPIGQFC